KKHVDFSSWPERDRSPKNVLHLLQFNLVNVIHTVRIHEARRAPHVAPVREINNKVRAAAVPNAQRSVIVNLLIVGASEITPRKQLLHAKKEIDIAAEYILKRPMPITDLSHQHATIFFKDLSLNQAWIIRECR